MRRTKWQVENLAQRHSLQRRQSQTTALRRGDLVQGVLDADFDFPVTTIAPSTTSHLTTAPSGKMPDAQSASSTMINVSVSLADPRSIHVYFRPLSTLTKVKLNELSHSAIPGAAKS
jgi:hypothetical protein